MAVIWPFSYVDQGEQTFYVKGQKLSISIFEIHTVSVATTQFRHSSGKAAVDNTPLYSNKTL